MMNPDIFDMGDIDMAWCPGCGACVKIRRLYAAFFFIVTFVVTVISFISILAQQGIYAALIFLPLPIGALGYVKARFCPLRAMDGDLGNNPQSRNHFV